MTSPSKTKVSDFHDAFVSDETVTGSQIPMYDCLPFEVLHALTYLDAHVD